MRKYEFARVFDCGEYQVLFSIEKEDDKDYHKLIENDTFELVAKCRFAGYEARVTMGGNLFFEDCQTALSNTTQEMADELVRLLSLADSKIEVPTKEETKEAVEEIKKEKEPPEQPGDNYEFHYGKYYPKIFSGSFQDLEKVGRIVRGFPLRDVVFVLDGENLIHYRGILGGFELFKVIPDIKSFEQAKEFAKNWSEEGYKDEG